MSHENNLTTATTEPARAAGSVTLAALVLLGVALRGVLLWRAENRLDCDESLIAFMALDILDGRAAPLFVYGTAYDGGGAFEAYLAAAGFAVFGTAPIVLKICALAVWSATAVLLAQALARWLAPAAAALAMLCFSVGTPFFLEWSVKGRGGFVETALLSVALLWTLSGPAWLERRPWVKHCLLGVAAAVGLWISEMLLAMIACVFAAAVIGQTRWSARCRAAGGIAAGLAIGLVPLVIYNATHDWANLRQSVVYTLMAHNRGAAPLSLGQLSQSVRFVFGPVWWLALGGLAVAAYRVARATGTKRTIGIVLLAHVIVYGTAYWLAGLRALPVPAARVLFTLYPSVAVLLGMAATPRGDRPRRHALATAAAVVWCALVLGSAAHWIAGGQPRESGSWRGRWSLYDTGRILQSVRASQTDLVLTSYWTCWPLALEARTAAREIQEAKPLVAVRGRHVEWNAADSSRGGLVLATAVPQRPLRRGVRTAVVLIDTSPALRTIERALESRGLAYDRTTIDQVVILTGLDASDLQRLSAEELAVIDGAAFWPLLPDEPDGFN